MRFDEIQALLAVVDQGSFLSASAALGVSRSTLRRQIEALEARIGTAIFSRTSSGAILTDAGRRLVEGARCIERDYRELLAGVRDENLQVGGELRMVVPAGMPPHVELAAATFQLQSWPAVRLRVRCTDAPLSVSPSDADVFIYFGSSAPTGSWRCEVLTHTRQRLFASGNYLDARGNPTRVEELSGHDLIVWHLPGEPESAWLSPPALAPPPRIAFASTNAHLVNGLCHAGRGIAYLPVEDAPVALGAEPLIPVLPDEVGRDLPLRIAVSSPVAKLPKVRVFLDQLRALATHVRSAQPRSAAPSE